MPRCFRLIRAAAAVAAILVAEAGLPAQTSVQGTSPRDPRKSSEVEALFTGVSLKIRDEIAGPGGIAQAKLFVTEPKPISTAGGRLRFAAFGSIDGVALMSPAGDTLGVAIVDGNELTVSIVSPSATFGTLDPDYPILTVVGRVPATAAVGSALPLEIDAASLRFTDGAGTIYPVDAKSGLLFVRPNVGVDDVSPGSADVVPGDVVTILGRGFKPTTRIRFKEVLLSKTQFLSATSMRVTLAQPTHMHGQGIKVINRDGAETMYFSYQRAARQSAGTHPAFANTVPIFADTETTAASVDVRGAVTGLAIQNRQAAAARVAAELVRADGQVAATATLAIEPNRFAVVELAELFGVAYSASQVVRVRSPLPVQVMGIAVDAAGSASPVAAR